MNLLQPVSEIMTRDLTVLSPTASIADAAAIFNTKKLHHIPIVMEGNLVGIVSKSDYLFFRRGFLDNKVDEHIEEIRMHNYEVSYIMTKGIAKVEPQTRINVALEIFKENIFHAIPVVQDEKLVGIVTTYDIINQLALDNGAVAEYS